MSMSLSQGAEVKRIDGQSSLATVKPSSVNLAHHL